MLLLHKKSHYKDWGVRVWWVGLWPISVGASVGVAMGGVGGKRWGGGGGGGLCLRVHL